MTATSQYPVSSINPPKRRNTNLIQLIRRFALTTFPTWKLSDQIEHLFTLHHLTSQKNLPSTFPTFTPNLWWLSTIEYTLMNLTHQSKAHCSSSLPGNHKVINSASSSNTHSILLGDPNPSLSPTLSSSHLIKVQELQGVRLSRQVLI